MITLLWQTRIFLKMIPTSPRISRSWFIISTAFLGSRIKPASTSTILTTNLAIAGDLINAMRGILLNFYCMILQSSTNNSSHIPRKHPSRRYIRAGRSDMPARHGWGAVWFSVCIWHYLISWDHIIIWSCTLIPIQILYTFHDHYKLSRSLCCVLLHEKKNIEIDRLCLYQLNYFPL